MELLKETGVDIQEGLACCADDPEFYEDMLGEYVSEAEMKIKELEQFFADRSWADYQIRAHSVKSMSRMIGAAALSETAREMEMAAKEQNESLLISCHAGFISVYRMMVENIRKALER